MQNIQIQSQIPYIYFTFPSLHFLQFANWNGGKFNLIRLRRAGGPNIYIYAHMVDNY